MKKLYSIRFGLAVLTLSAFFSTGYGAYLESDYKGEPGGIVLPTPDRPVIPSPPNDLGSEVRHFIRNLRIGEPYSYGGLTLFPLYHPSGSDSRGYLPMDEAVRRGDLVLRERQGGVVSEVLASNNSDRSVFLMAGEIFVGGKQNRTLRTDVILPPGCRDTVLPVYCVEKGRWEEAGGAGFSSKGYLSSSAVRERAMSGGSQGEVWEEVDRVQEIHGIKSGTGDHSLLFESNEFRERMDDYISHCRPVMVDRPVGLAVVRGSEIAGVEIFVDAGLLESHWEKIVKSYLSDWPVILHREHEHIRPPFPGRERIRRFLAQIDSARFTIQSNPGSGADYRIHGSIYGSSLSHRGEPVHTALHEGVRIMYDQERSLE